MSEHPVSVNITGPSLSINRDTRETHLFVQVCVLICDHTTGGEYLPAFQCDPIPKHRVTIKHADGSETLVIIKNANSHDLSDEDFMIAIVTGDWDHWLMKQQGKPGKEARQ
jgi:hypothetical protein